MDVVTQVLLGAVSFSTVTHKELGNKSLLIGSVCGLIPDLDVLAKPFFTEIEFISVHRSISHSLIFALVLSGVISALLKKYDKSTLSITKWYSAIFLAIFSHAILDWCTTFGTKLLCPFTPHLFSCNSIHVFHPLYSIILLVGVLGYRFSKRIRAKALYSRGALLVSCLFLTWTFVSKGLASSEFSSQLEKQGIEYYKLMVTPTPFNSLLWHGIVKAEGGYYLGTYSLLDDREEITFHFEKSEDECLENICSERLVDYYLHYTSGFPLVKKEGKEVRIYAIKYGPVNYFGEPEFVFPLKLNLNQLEEGFINIEKTSNFHGPMSNLKSLYKRVKGI